jgi:hypothetical protein
MSIVSTHSMIHGTFKNFVKWIAPEPDSRDQIYKQADEIKSRIKAKAEEDGLIVKSTPFSGSFERITGLRRFMRGHSVVEGQDVDIAFIVAQKDKDGNTLDCLVGRFETYTKQSYPDSEVGSTKSSATLKFRSNLRYDLVPLFETSNADIQLLKRTTGEERTTSVTRHVEFTTRRTAASKNLDGIVKYNECIRLIKWWRYEQQEHSGVFGNEEGDETIPSFLLDLLCAFAFDNKSLDKTYAGSLAKWFGFLAHVVRNKKEVTFSLTTGVDHSQALWRVIDPIDKTNNIVSSWNNAKINELARILENSRDEINRAIRYDEQGDDAECMRSLVKLFGNAIENNSN